MPPIPRPPPTSPLHALPPGPPAMPTPPTSNASTPQPPPVVHRLIDTYTAAHRIHEAPAYTRAMRAWTSLSLSLPSSLDDANSFGDMVVLYAATLLVVVALFALARAFVAAMRRRRRRRRVERMMSAPFAVERGRRSDRGMGWGWWRDGKGEGLDGRGEFCFCTSACLLLVAGVRKWCWLTI
ncbi:hypothetical protein IWZ01DRAFT_574794 [Phyllosticta capitalensis]